MNYFSALVVAQSRTEEFAREAAASRQAGLFRRRERDAQTPPRPAPRTREVARPVTV
ncbi:hypothetical protein [Actinophytocola sp.]|uniref:hypothetical protein n=1 Tax=Actinophytocola sp. TaxID=1872138 RepID=UPI002D80FF89|nr:hypothetical protein [Actinophytocola sp.]HET9142555.1 hypothetical protein [Actinophytocola sp.]